MGVPVCPLAKGRDGSPISRHNGRGAAPDKPDLPETDFRSEQDILKLPGVKVMEAADVAPGRTVDTYAFSRETTQRNLFRIPIP